MFQLVKSEVLSLTPELAQQFRDMSPSPTERDLDKNRLKMLSDAAENGRLITFHWSTAVLGDKRLRINGQHSSKMLCDLNGEFPAGLKAHHDEYRVDNEEDLVLLYRQLDARKSGRSSKDIAWAYQGLVSELHDVPKATAKLAIDAVAWHQRVVTREPTPTGDDVYGMFNERVLHPFIKWIGELFHPSKTGELKNKGIFGAMYATFIANDPEARKFWHDVAIAGVPYEDDAPSTVLDEWLKKNDEAVKSLEVAQLYQGCVYAWNAFRDGKAIKSVKHDTTKSWYEVKA
jgi:hypothetical protein